MHIAVLITCFNRKALTLQCLAALVKSVECMGRSDFIVDLWLNDDGSTDGTADAVKAWHSSVKLESCAINLNIVQGSGADYWCGGMRRAWQEAVDSGIVYDGYLWLNDDTVMMENALELLLTSPKVESAILVGAICSTDGARATFGGEDARGFRVPDGTWHKLCQMNGNVVWVPAAVYAELGILDSCWTHAMGDGDYSRTACEKGIEVLLSPVFVGRSDRSLTPVPWQDPSVPLFRRIRNLYSPLGYAEPPLLFRYCLRHDGFLTALRNVITSHLIVLFPSLKRK